MCEKYLKVPERLIEYRKKLGKTQEEMSVCLGMKQENYCQIEKSKFSLSNKSLVSYHKKVGDVFYLITGRERYQGLLYSYMEKCKTFSGKIEFLKMVLWLTNQGAMLCNIDAAQVLNRTWKNIQLAEQLEKKENLWISLRKNEGLSQVQIASRLDVNTKRYQRLESGKSHPNAEIVHTLFFEFGYSPSLLLGVDYFYSDEVDRLWNYFTEDVRKNLISCLEENMKLIIEQENMEVVHPGSVRVTTDDKI